MNIAHTLLPFGDFLEESVEQTPTHLTLTARSVTPLPACPQCGTGSHRVHSTYLRTVADLPVLQRQFVLRFRVRRLFCDQPRCSQRIFGEQLPAIKRYARRTDRLTAALQTLAFAVGGLGSARLGQHLAFPTSPRTQLRLLHAYQPPAPAAPRVVGLDDWAWKKGRTYGTICVDLERQQPIDLLPDREPATVAAWLKAHPTIEIISRDRGRDYIEGARQGAPQARQIADRWHVLVNFGDAVEHFFRHQTLHLKAAADRLNTQATLPDGTGQAMPTLDGASVTGRARQRQTGESARMGARYAQVQALHAEGLEVATIAWELQISRRTAYRYLAMDAPPPVRIIQVRDRHVLAPWKPYLVQRWNEGCRNALQLWRELRDQHQYPYSPRTVARFLTVLRQDSGHTRSFRAVPAQPIYTATQERKRPLSAGQARRLWLADPDDLEPWQEQYRAILCDVPLLATAYALSQRFLRLIRERQQQVALDQWIADVQASGIGAFRTFAAGLRRDYGAVTAAVTEIWSQGQTEAQIHRLKLLKRAMFGQAGFTLLRNRVLYRTPPYQPKHRSNRRRRAGHKVHQAAATVARSRAAPE